MQGTIQGSSISPELFKVVHNPVLDAITDRHLGAKIGTICCSIPTCADDTAILASTNSHEDTLSLSVVIDELNKNRISINSSKTEILHYNNTRHSKPQSLQINGAVVDDSQSATHLGILQGPDPDINNLRVTERITKATKALYALLGAGMHGRNGINPVISRKLWTCFITPVLLYGSELWALQPKHIQLMEKFQLSKLRCIQNLPDRTANAAVLGLLGIRPVEAEIHLRVLGLFLNVTDLEQEVEHEIAHRQLAMKDHRSHSWFIYVDKILRKYDLPSAHYLIANRGDKKKWKQEIKDVITLHWEKKLQAEDKPSIRYISKESLSLSKPALLWTSSTCSPRETQKARVKGKLLCGAMRLQVHDSMYSGGRIPPTCVLCGREAENRMHFLLRCHALEEIRSFHMPRVFEILHTHLTQTIITPEILMQALLDPTDILAGDVSADESLTSEIMDTLESVSRNMILQLSRKRAEMLNLPGPPTAKKGKKLQVAKKLSVEKAHGYREPMASTNEGQANGR
jgi:hypothetical protein